MKLFVAVTDNDWYRYLRDHTDHGEANFWRPSGRGFHVLQPGEPLLFKLHRPYHRFIAGGGFLAHRNRLPYTKAWEYFGECNGAPSLPEMRRRILKYRRDTADPYADYEIGCINLVGLFFFDEEEWIPVPPSFSANTQVGKTYTTEEAEGARLWEQVQLRLRAARNRESTDRQLAELPQPGLYSDPVSTRRRLGQGTFRSLVTDVYHRRCAVTGERALPVLEAAHVKPVHEGGPHEIGNGLLLRSDLHKLFDRGYVTVDERHRLRVSRKLKDEYDNGEPYYPLAGREIWQPRRRQHRVDPHYLEWHRDVVFRG